MKHIRKFFDWLEHWLGLIGLALMAAGFVVGVVKLAWAHPADFASVGSWMIISSCAIALVLWVIDKIRVTLQRRALIRSITPTDLRSHADVIGDLLTQARAK